MVEEVIGVPVSFEVTKEGRPSLRASAKSCRCLDGGKAAVPPNFRYDCSCHVSFPEVAAPPWRLTATSTIRGYCNAIEIFDP